MKPDLSIQIGKLHLSNPVMPASGTFGEASCQLVNADNLGAIIPKSITLNPREGNPPPRVTETASGMMNSVGIQNKGLDHFVKEILPFYEKYSPPLIASISGFSTEEFTELVRTLNECKRVNAIELNISCPNLKTGGKSFGMNSDDTYNIIKAVRCYTDKTIIAKLTPNVTDICSIALAAQDAGVDAVSLTNTYTALAIDIHTRKPKLSNIIGGLSGPAIKPISLRLVWQVSKVVSIPVIGIGGICSADDAIEFLLAGASAVQVGTCSFVNPKCMEEIIKGIEEYMIKYNFTSLKDIIGQLSI